MLCYPYLIFCYIIVKFCHSCISFSDIISFDMNTSNVNNQIAIFLYFRHLLLLSYLVESAVLSIQVSYSLFKWIWQDVQSKVSDVVLGKEKPVEETDPEYEKMKHYIFELENHLAEAQKHAYRLVKRHRGDD